MQPLLCILRSQERIAAALGRIAAKPGAGLQGSAGGISNSKYRGMRALVVHQLFRVAGAAFDGRNEAFGEVAFLTNFV